MIKLNDPSAMLAIRLPWDQIEASVSATLERQDRADQVLEGRDLSGPIQILVDVGHSNAGRPMLAMRLMAGLCPFVWNLTSQAAMDQ